ncbi:hypothetical protein ES703_125691 [subsurface metagenome]
MIDIICLTEMHTKKTPRVKADTAPQAYIVGGWKSIWLGAIAIPIAIRRRIIPGGNELPILMSPTMISIQRLLGINNRSFCACYNSSMNNGQLDILELEQLSKFSISISK